MKKFLLTLNRASYGVLDVAYIGTSTLAVHHWLGDKSLWLLLAGAVLAGVLLAFLHALWNLLFDNFYDDFDACEVTPESDIDFLENENLSLLQVGDTWGVLDSDRVLVGKFQDTPHAAVSSARVEVANG